jgi:glycosyltransferase involved in cell wall biosynthesis
MPAAVADHRQRARLEALQALVINLAQKDFDARYPDHRLPPVVVLICAYEEEDNIGAVLAKVPKQSCGLDTVALVVVDGGDDDTDKVAAKAGALTFVFPANLGHGVALRTGYRLCVAGGARYVVTLDADGQNDPSEIETMLQPLVDDEADFVVASRRLGVDRTSDSYRKLGVVFFAWLMNRLNKTNLTDTSNGYRALRATMLADIVDRLEQEQYQTAELLTTAVRRGWRITERPTVWYPRTSGESKKGTNVLYGFRYARVLINTWLRER